MRRRTPHRVTQRWWMYWVRETDCVWTERKGLLLDCIASAKENRKESGQSGPRLGRLGLIGKAYTVRSGSISVDSDTEGPSYQLALNSKNSNLKMLNHSSTHQWHNIPESAHSGSSPQCSTFSGNELFDCLDDTSGDLLAACLSTVFSVIHNCFEFHVSSECSENWSPRNV